MNAQSVRKSAVASYDSALRIRTEIVVTGKAFVTVKTTVGRPTNTDICYVPFCRNFDRLLLHLGLGLQSGQPIAYAGADRLGVVLLEVMNAGANVGQLAIL